MSKIDCSLFETLYLYISYRFCMFMQKFPQDVKIKTVKNIQKTPYPKI